MILQVTNWEEHTLAMIAIDGILTKTTTAGKFENLADVEQSELYRLSLLVEAFEDSIPLMPIRALETTENAARHDPY